MLEKLIPILFSVFMLFANFGWSQSWQDVGGGTNNSSHGMIVWNNQLVNLGSFNNPCNRVAVWNGTSWSCLGGGVGIVARAACIWNGNLVVVGDFWNNFQPCSGCNGVAMWDGTQWTGFDQGFNNDVLTCTVYNGDLIIGGDFTQANGVPINRVARWNPTTGSFESMGAVTDMDNDVRCMTVYDGDLWVGGDFNNVGGNPPSDGVVKWDETSQSWVGGNSGVDLVGGVNETVRVLYVNPNDGNLYMGGEFPELHDGDATNPDYNMSGVAMYDGDNWYSLGTGLNEYCRAIHEYNGDLIVGGYFTVADGVSCNKIARWNTTTQTFSPMGLGFDANGIDEYVKSAVSWNGTFYAGGAYTQAEGSPMNYIAQWTDIVTNPPTATINSGGVSEVCSNECIDFSDLSTNSPTSWNWYFPGSNTPTSSVQNPGNVCYSSPGTYTAKLVTCNSLGCDSITMNVTVNAIPTIALSDQSICEGESTTISTSVSQLGGDYLWSPGGETSSSIAVSPTTTTSYSVEYTLNGCLSSLESATITVNPIPSVSVQDNNICAGQSITITATESPSGGTFIWSPISSASNSITISPTSTGDYIVEYTLNGCSQSDTSTIIVNSTYNQTETVSSCLNGNFTFPDGTSQLISGITTHISNLTSVNGCDSIITTTVNPINTIFSENSSVCSGGDFTYPDGTTSTNITANESHVSNLIGSSGCDSIITTNITVTPLPTVQIPSNSYTICEGESIQLLTQVSSSGGTYNWTPNGETTSSITVSPGLGTHIYSVSYSLNGCNSEVDSTTVLVEEMPDVTLSAVNNTIMANQIGASYQWIDCSTGNDIQGENNQSFTPTSNGEYQVLVTLNNCSDYSSCYTINTIGVFEDLMSSIEIYPNPVSSVVTIEAPLEILGSELTIIDAVGKTVYESQITKSIKIDLSDLSKGVYQIMIDNSLNFRLIKN